MKRTLTYVVLGMVLLLSSLQFVSSGWAAESDVISFTSRKSGNFTLHFTNTRGEILRHITFKTPSMYGHTWSPDGGSFSYTSNTDGNNEIYVMDIRKKTQRQLTHHPSSDSGPAWSPNRKWITFVSDRRGKDDIYRMDANGENVMQLTNQGECHGPTWSPDSQSIAFTSSSEGNYFIYVMGADGRRLRQLVGNMPVPGCTWSPDGKQIAFISRDAEGGMDLFSIDVNGKNLRQLTWSDQSAFISEPVWSPSGKWIAYVLTEVMIPLKPILLPKDFADPVIYIVNTVDGAGGKPIKATKELTKGFMFGTSLAWVPEGFFSVSPSAEKRTTLWGELKQTDK